MTTWPPLSGVDEAAFAQQNLLQTEKLDRDGAIPLTAGLKWPATQVPSADVNTLDDYEEGTWTPVRHDFTEVMGGGSITNAGYYTKIGRLVVLTATITCAGGATIAAVAGSSYLTGLPFTPAVPTSGTWVNATTAAGSGHVFVYPGGPYIFICNAWAAASQVWTITAIFWV